MGDINFTDNKIEHMTVNQKNLLKKDKSSVGQNKTAFIVYGCRDKNESLISEIKSFLKKKGIDGSVLDDDPRIGTTIFDAFEKATMSCEAVIVLLTPDENQYPRPNVMFEWGYFLGKYSQLERRNIIVIKQNGVKVPSDVNNVFFFQIDSSIIEIYDELSAAISEIFFTEKTLVKGKDKIYI